MKKTILISLISTLLVACNSQKSTYNIDSVASPLGTEVFQDNWENIAAIPGMNGDIVAPRDVDALYLKMREWVENPDKLKIMSTYCRGLVETRFERKMVWQNCLNEYLRLAGE